MAIGTIAHGAAVWIWSWAREHPSVEAGIVKMFKRPRLVLSLPEADGFCSQVVKMPRPGRSGQEQLARFIRVKIENTGRSVATGVRVYIDTMTINRQRAITRDLSNVLSLKDHDTFEPFALPPDIPSYVNVCAALHEDAILAFTSRAATRGAHAYNVDGEYEVTIRAEGENFVSPGEIAVRVTFNRSAPLSSRVALITARGNMRVA